MQEALIKAREYIEYSLEINGPDPAGKGLEALNAIDNAIAAFDRMHMSNKAEA